MSKKKKKTPNFSENGTFILEEIGLYTVAFIAWALDRVVFLAQVQSVLFSRLSKQIQAYHNKATLPCH